jgi:hypothetical protein
VTGPRRPRVWLVLTRIVHGIDKAAVLSDLPTTTWHTCRCGATFDSSAALSLHLYAAGDRDASTATWATAFRGPDAGAAERVLERETARGREAVMVPLPDATEGEN